MRLKGINPIEQHGEKILAVLFGAAAIGVLAWQFVGPPNTVDVGPKKAVPLDLAFESVAEEARKTQRRIGLIEVEPPPADPKAGQFALSPADFGRPVAPAPTLASGPLDRPESIEVARGGSGGRGASPIPPLEIPAPGTPLAASYMATIHPVEYATVPEVAALLPKEGAPDKAAVSIEAVFDGTAVREALSNDPDGPTGEQKPMPRFWYEGLQILAVEAEREEQLPDGSWGKATKVTPIPGRYTLADELAKPLGGAELREYMRAAADQAELVRRPPFWRIFLGEDWLPPADRKAKEEAALAGGGDNQTAARNEFNRLQKDIARLTEERAKIEDGAGGPRGRGNPPAGEEGGRGGRGGGGRGGRQAPPRGGENDQKVRDNKLRNIDARLATATARRNALAAQLGEKIEGQDALAEVPTVPSAADKAAEASVLDNPEIRLWFHDVGVERGKTYRYRLSLVLNNPLYGHGAALVAAQSEMAKDPLVRSQPSEWCEGVTVDPERFYFITSASEGGQLNPVASARADMFLFTWGYWRRGSDSVEPGDYIQAEVKVPDFSEQLAQIVAGAAQNPGQAPGVPGNEGDSDRGRGGRRRFGNPQDPVRQPGQGVAEPVAVTNVKTVNVAAHADDLLVGVAEAPLEKGRAAQVFLRRADGQVVTRSPDEEKSNPAFGRLVRSAELGEQALKPKEAKPVDNPAAPERGRPDEPPPAGGPQGGGGAGGG